MANECEVVLSYATGETRPVTMMVQTHGTARVDDRRLSDLLRVHFDFRPAAILRQFRLRRLPAERPNGFYQHLAAYGHFGREDMDLPWEQTDLADVLRSAIDG